MDAVTQPPVIRLHPEDGVVIARMVLPPGTTVAPGVRAEKRIPAGHKVAIRPHAKGEAVRRYGQVIGFATRDIAPGEWVHVEEIAMGDFSRDYAFGADLKPTEYVPEPATFLGIRRPDGRVATRNYVGIVTSVNCSAHVAELIALAFRRNPITGEDPLAAWPNVDGVVALTHKTGCGMAQGEPLSLLRRTIGGYARHPNFSHVVAIGLGCEVNQIGGMMQEQRLADRLRSMDIQEMGGARKTVEAGIAFVRSVLDEANAVRREPVPAGELCVALQCGGSDGYSGISANPALGVASDLVVRHGGTVILSETTETYGAEHLLTRRAVSPEVGQKLVDLMHWWEDYTAKEGAEINANPSPGNKAGGLTTILEKSLGAMAKAGHTNLVEVYRYAEPVAARGFVFMDTPGYDPVAATGQVAGGANLVCFTTGRGSVFGAKPAPSLKLATNSAMYERMQDDMDINCGTILTGEETVEQCGERIFRQILRVASGERTRSEEFDFGAAEFAPWQIGATV
ncbi:Galactarate/altronate dehydratase family protein [Roseomonas mucosa]|uniref:D-galactarate dehydratase n=1 Tax=Roseomonas mucosa TaxID=207340 RepID=A0A379MVS3_9PROT|nr:MULTISPECIES: altronate dehydratase family protein [Roseomonas]MBS5902906.1 altronate dehydratase [Acetobacteraceae bacterium]AWV24406.1 Galactarate/altronate dehydratase family protein [Roseomonas mucosa]MCG7354305.1 altronate dehydratase family protein [Roseomonas mucosa]MCG7359367.1 altronate dehydratase family protein [Roseomonas mucosa]MDT8274865.1 altronate dehydratase family protein [Roseomonas mucosa]